MSIGDSFKIGNSLSQSTKDLQKASERLASGSRINRASDDAAGLAIVSALDADVRTSLQSARNALDGVSITAIADGALQQISDITARQGELAAQSANGTLSDTQRQSLDQEFQQLDQEKNRILQTTTFNGVNVFSSTTLQVGNDSSSNSQISTPGVSTSSITSTQSIATAAGAQTAIDAIKTQIDTVSKVRGEIGSVVNRLDVARNNSESKAVESTAAASRIRDADVATEVANRTAAGIKQQIGTALSAQTGKLNGSTIAKLLQ